MINEMVRNGGFVGFRPICVPIAQWTRRREMKKREEIEGNGGGL